MKLLIVLALTVAVSSAAFTGSLVQQTQPFVNQIKADLSLNLKARSSAEVGLQNALLEGIQDHISGVLDQIESAIEQIQNGADSIIGEIIGAVGQLQNIIENLGSQAEGVAQQLIQNIQNILGNLLGNLVGGNQNGRASFQISAQLAAIIQSILAQENVNQLIHSSQLYQCIDANLRAAGVAGGLDYAFIQGLNEANNLNVDYLLTSPFVAPCVAAQGGPAELILNSAIVARIRELAAQLGLTETLHAVIIRILGPEHGQNLIDLFGQNNRGLFDNFGNWASGIWESLTIGAANLGNLLSSIASHAWANVAAKLEAIRQVAMAYITNGIENAQQLGLAAAQQLIDTIVPVFNQLGQLGRDVVTQLKAIYQGINIPDWILNSLNDN